MGEAKDLEILKGVLEDKTLLETNFDMWSLWLICQACQLTCTHPAISAPLRKQYVDLGKLFQNYIIQFHPEAEHILAAGWMRSRDVPEPFSTLAPVRKLPVNRMGGRKRRKQKPT